jgi:hypothetical protein
MIPKKNIIWWRGPNVLPVIAPDGVRGLQISLDEEYGIDEVHVLDETIRRLVAARDWLALARSAVS